MTDRDNHTSGLDDPEVGKKIFRGILHADPYPVPEGDDTFAPKKRSDLDRSSMHDFISYPPFPLHDDFVFRIEIR